MKDTEEQSQQTADLVLSSIIEKKEYLLDIEKDINCTLELVNQQQLKEKESIESLIEFKHDSLNKFLIKQ